MYSAWFGDALRGMLGKAAWREFLIGKIRLREWESLRTFHHPIKYLHFWALHTCKMLGLTDTASFRGCVIKAGVYPSVIQFHHYTNSFPSRCNRYGRRRINTVLENRAGRGPTVKFGPIYFNTLYRAPFTILHYDQQMHNYFTNYYTATCFDTIVSSSDSL
jgi:hypothetical protein